MVTAFSLCTHSEISGQIKCGTPPKTIAAPPASNGVSEDAKKLVGTWTVVSITRDGRDLRAVNLDPVGKVSEFTFTERDVTIRLPRRDAVSEYELDTKSKPKAIRITSNHERFYYGAELKGVYEFEGDMLKLVLGPPDSHPSEISDKNQGLFILKRKAVRQHEK